MEKETPFVEEEKTYEEILAENNLFTAQEKKVAKNTLGIAENLLSTFENNIKADTLRKKFAFLDSINYDEEKYKETFVEKSILLHKELIDLADQNKEIFNSFYIKQQANLALKEEDVFVRHKELEKLLFSLNRDLQFISIKSTEYGLSVRKDINSVYTIAILDETKSWFKHSNGTRNYKTLKIAPISFKLLEEFRKIYCDLQTKRKDIFSPFRERDIINFVFFHCIKDENNIRVCDKLEDVDNLDISNLLLQDVIIGRVLPDILPSQFTFRRDHTEDSQGYL